MEEVIKKINRFRDEREWRQFHKPKDLAISIVLEATELLEKFQWKSSDEAIKKDLDGIKEEIADCLMYLLMLSDDLDLNVKEIVLDKLSKNNEKYPVEKSKGSNKKYTEL